jgi:hypothetical protein
MDIDQELSLASQYQQSGQLYDARTTLRKILAVDRRNVQAWLLFSMVAEKPAHEIQCLQTVLRLEPANAYAAQRLGELRSPAPRMDAGEFESAPSGSGWLRGRIPWIISAAVSFIGLCIIACLLVLKWTSSGTP